MAVPTIRPNKGYHEIFIKFAEGAISSEQAAQQLQNLVALIFNES